MGQPETPAEVHFMKVLDDYGKLLKGQEHIGFKDEAELRRHLVWYSTDELRIATLGLISTLYKMGDIISAATRGEIRHSWATHIGDCCRQMTRFGDVVHAVHAERYN